MIAKLPILAVAVSSLLATACFWDTSSDNPPRVTRTPTEQPAATTAKVEPMLVHLDTDRTMSAVAGEGVGVFVEYKSGGKWRVWLACDTNITGDACQMSVSATAPGLADLTGQKADSLQKTVVVSKKK